MTDINSLSYLFPKLEEAGLPVPKTRILNITDDARDDLWALFDGKDGSGGMPAFAEQIAAIGDEFGFPFFLRTGHTSGKHNWDKTCFISSRDRICDHIAEIATLSEMSGFMGLPWDQWAVREYLPIIPFGVCANYGNMPVCKEFRFFVNHGKVQCYHPYWPLKALQDGGAPADVAYAELCRMPSTAALIELAEQAGRAVPGYWSVDILETKRGWFITDMADGDRSFHWEGCAS